MRRNFVKKNRQKARKKKTHFRVTLKETTKEDLSFYLVKTKLGEFLFSFSFWRYMSFVCIRWLFATYCCMEFLCKTRKITLLKMSRESYSLEWKEWHSRKVKRRATLKKELFFAFIYDRRGSLKISWLKKCEDWNKYIFVLVLLAFVKFVYQIALFVALFLI